MSVDRRRDHAVHGRARRRLRQCLGLASLLLAFAAAPAPALADGDPASDILVNEDVYYGYGIDLRSKAAAQLPALLEESRKRGYEMKVALISGFTDLGIATWMWLDPREYARYLGDELQQVYKGRILILMRNGYGIYYNATVPGKERRVISQLQRPARAARFLDRGIDAVVELAAANGVKLKVPDVEPPPGGMTQGEAHLGNGLPELESPATEEPTPTATPVAADSAPSSSSTAWLFLLPVALFAVAAGIAKHRARGRT